MQNRLAGLLVAVAVSFTVGGTALAQADPTVHQIYEAASSGHLDQAQQMIDQVLRDHPESAKAHYVQSELYAREGKLPLARAELDRAERLAPGLPKENPRSVAELRSQLGLLRRGSNLTQQSPLHFPWGTVLIVALAVGVFWALFRRRTTYASYPPGATVPTAPPGTYGPGGYGPGGPVGGGIGSTVAGGLAGGLAAGAGFVAGEELAHHFLDGRQQGAPPPPAEDYGESAGANSDMGGDDFGVNDPGSWDDGSAAGGDGSGGGDDWT